MTEWSGFNDRTVHSIVFLLYKMQNVITYKTTKKNPQTTIHDLDLIRQTVNLSVLKKMQQCTSSIFLVFCKKDYVLLL